MRRLRDHDMWTIAFGIAFGLWAGQDRPEDRMARLGVLRGLETAFQGRVLVKEYTNRDWAIAIGGSVLVLLLPFAILLFLLWMEGKL